MAARQTGAGGAATEHLPFRVWPLSGCSGMLLATQPEHVSVFLPQCHPGSNEEAVRRGAACNAGPQPPLLAWIAATAPDG